MSWKKWKPELIYCRMGFVCNPVRSVHTKFTPGMNVAAGVQTLSGEGIMMNGEKRIAQLFGLHGENWNRHANPWSFWTRFATLPFLILAIWSRVWFGWGAVLLVLVLLVWLFINPVLFKKQKNIDNWASKAVFGEKYWTERTENPVPRHHHAAITILTLLQLSGGILLGIGLWELEADFVISGTIISYLSKMWFLDRMVWIYDDMTRAE